MKIQLFSFLFYKEIRNESKESFQIASSPNLLSWEMKVIFLTKKKTF